ncbi:hypothetical protein C8R44DRAFT_374072 [Mycena epipterygia]|nr:hypothetical protein C8R44DRAFT_374072 [Mycena epipterygia]
MVYVALTTSSECLCSRSCFTMLFAVCEQMSSNLKQGASGATTPVSFCLHPCFDAFKVPQAETFCEGDQGDYQTGRLFPNSFANINLPVRVQAREDVGVDLSHTPVRCRNSGALWDIPMPVQAMVPTRRDETSQRTSVLEILYPRPSLPPRPSRSSQGRESRRNRQGSPPAYVSQNRRERLNAPVEDVAPPPYSRIDPALQHGDGR